MDELVVHGIYLIQDQYFIDFKKPYWMDNKNENRPYYYLVRDADGIDWVIPLSSQTENYRAKINKIEEQRGKGNCIYYHIGKIASTERVFLIGDMFPVNASYIKSAFKIGYQHYIVQNEKLNKAIYSKSMRFLKLVSIGKIKSRNDIMGIKRILISQRENDAYII